MTREKLRERRWNWICSLDSEQLQRAYQNAVQTRKALSKVADKLNEKPKAPVMN